MFRKRVFIPENSKPLTLETPYALCTDVLCVQSQELLELYGQKEPERLASMRPAVEATLDGLIGSGSDALLIPEGAGWAWGRDLPAAAWLLKARTPGHSCVVYGDWLG